MSFEILGIVPAIIIIAIVCSIIFSHESPLKMIAGATAAIIVLAVVLVPALTDATADDSIRFDDYVAVGDDTTVDGVFEITTIGTETYAHATSTGLGKIDGKLYDVQKAPLDIFLIMGQSNAAYSYYDVSTASPVAKPGTTYYFGTESQPNTQTVTGTGMFDAVDLDTGEAKIGHLEMPFMAEYSEKTGHKVYTINTGWNGANIGLLTVGGSHYNYEQRTARLGFLAIDQEGYTVNAVGYIWLQGESDAGLGTEVPTYKERFLKLYDAITWKGSDKFVNQFKMDYAFIVQTRTERGPNTAVALQELADENAGIFMATTMTLGFTTENGMMRDDNLHYTQAAYNRIGVAVADYIAENALY